jgi:hypothetical protein
LSKQFYILVFTGLCITYGASAQNDIFRRIPRSGSFGGKSSGGKDTSGFKKRSGLEDSITITFRYLDSSRLQKFDSSITDFTVRYPIPADYLYLGNTGNAAKSMLFSPLMKAGWDPGFHAFDLYMFKPEQTRFFNTTRPYTELGYLVGSKSEQLIHLLHTQNINPNWNMAARFQLINSPGFFKNQNASHNSYEVSSLYQSPGRRYRLFAVVVNNKIQTSENGGIVNVSLLDSTETFKANARNNIPVYLGNPNPGNINPFSTFVETGNKYRLRHYLLRQQYDFGKKDSLVTDSTVIKLFYPKWRLEHTFRYNTHQYTFEDNRVEAYNDTGFYRKFYRFLAVPDRYMVEDSWTDMTNDISIYQFPDSKNPQQFFKIGASFQQLNGSFDAGTNNYYNGWVHGEYHNKTRNKKWDMDASAELYIAGANAGDYYAYASLKRMLGKKAGYLTLGFQNVNRTPSFIFNSSSSFNFTGTGGFNKENTVRLFGIIDQPWLKLKLSGDYFLVSNYTYFRNYYIGSQASTVFNLLRVTAEKEIRLSKRLVWETAVALQQKAGTAPVNVPLVFTRNRIGYQGSLGFTNLRLTTGLEIRYNTPFKADGYSPVLGQFFYQDTTTVRLQLPHISAYFHFRIRSFAAYIRFENLNTARTQNGFEFTNNNLSFPGYPMPGLQFRVGIFWGFVN